MLLHFDFSLLRDNTATAAADVDESVQTLKRGALVAFGLAKGRLLDSGRLLDRGSIKKARLLNRKSLTLHSSAPQVQATRQVFIAVLGDGSVETCFVPDHGGDSNIVQHRLHDVRETRAIENAFAALLVDGTVVVTWGGVVGRDSKAAQEQLKSAHSSAAILADRSMVTSTVPLTGTPTFEGYPEGSFKWCPKGFLYSGTLRVPVKGGLL